MPAIRALCEGRGHELVELEDGGLEITRRYDDGSFIFYAYEIEAWVRLEALVLDDEEMAALEDEAVFFKFIATLQSRVLGCRFGFDGRGLFILTDVYPETGTKVFEVVLDQLPSVWACAKPLFLQAVDGTLPSDGDIDDAFDLRAPH